MAAVSWKSMSDVTYRRPRLDSIFPRNVYFSWNVFVFPPNQNFFFFSWFVDAGVELVSRKSPGVNSKVSARLDANFLSFTAKPKKHEVFPCWCLFRSPTMVSWLASAWSSWCMTPPVSGVCLMEYVTERYVWLDHLVASRLGIRIRMVIFIWKRTPLRKHNFLH